MASADRGPPDFLILGGGSAGCVLAARLSEDPARSVCLVEAGPDYGPFAAGGWPADLLDARMLPESHPWDPDQPLLRARVIGGCSSHNAAYLTWGPERDYDEWEAAGADRWGWRAIEPYLARARAAIGARALEDGEVGPWAVAAAAAAEQSGIPVLGDLSEPGSVEGVGPNPVNMAGSVRWNAAFAYLDDARGRDNLTVLGGTLADRVVIDGGRVTGAVIRRGGEAIELVARTVILASGAFGSPQILLRSGVGPADDLRTLGIEVVADRANVGAGLQDHFGVAVVFTPTPELAAAIGERDRAGQMLRGGPIIKSASTLCEPGTWDLHHLGWCAPDLDGLTGAGWRVQLSSYAMKPRSRGRVRLVSADPLVAAEIDPGFLADPDGTDLAVVVDGIERVRRIAAAPAIASVVEGEAAPGPAARSRPDLEGYVRDNVRSYFHATGTCRAGREEDGAVVDPAGRVHGLEGLYVADASTLPSTPRANTHLTTLAIAEVIADGLKRMDR